MVAVYRDLLKVPARPLAPDEVATHEGGIAHALDDWGRLRRFLILGSEGGTYYVGQADLTAENAAVVKRCLAADGARTVGEVVAISEAGRAPKNEPAILALAMAASAEQAPTRKAALAALPRVCRTGTHLLHFAAYADAMRGWGRGLRTAIGEWFQGKDADELAYQAIKYKSRDGWSLADLLRLSHPVPGGEAKTAVYKYIVDGTAADEADGVYSAKRLMVTPPQLLAAIDLPRYVNERQTAVSLIREHRLPREAVPSELLNSAEVWDALLADMPITATIRNLGKMTAVGLLADGSDAARTVADRITDADRLKRGRVHPLSLLLALKVYEQGHGEKGSLSWRAVKKIVNALDEAFYLAFGAVEPSGKRLRLALDVSGSMGGTTIAGTCLTARDGAAALALVTAATERDCEIVAYSHQMVPVDVRPSMRLDEVVRTIGRIPMGGTYCSLPFADMLAKGIDRDAVISYTDSETWDGSTAGPHFYFGDDSAYNATRAMSVAQWADAYRQKVGHRVASVVVGMTSNGFTLARPGDPDALDVVGFDAATPQLISEFVAGRM